MLLDGRWTSWHKDEISIYRFRKYLSRWSFSWGYYLLVIVYKVCDSLLNHWLNWLNELSELSSDLCCSRTSSTALAPFPSSLCSDLNYEILTDLISDLFSDLLSGSNSNSPLKNMPKLKTICINCKTKPLNKLRMKKRLIIMP